MADHGSLTSDVIEQSWQYNKVDEELLQLWLHEIETFERQRRDAAAQGYEEHQQFQKSFGGFKSKVPITPSEENNDFNILDESSNLEENREMSDTLLTPDLWRSIFTRVNIEDLPRCAGVCRQFRRLVKDENMWARAFETVWQLEKVVGVPSSSLFWKAKISHFAISHELTRMDSIASLAVKYNVQVMDIRRQNMMMSDHGIHSRDRMLIPVTSPDWLRGKVCYIETDVHARREVAVVYLDGKGPDDKESLSAKRARMKSAAKMKEKITESFRKSLGVDDGTAAFYLEIAGGDVRGAYSEYLEDLKWERQSKSARMGS